MGAAASIDSDSSAAIVVTVDKARSLLEVDATDDADALAGRVALFEDWWAKLPKNAEGAVPAADWNRGVEEARTTMPQLAKHSQSASTEADDRAATDAASAAGADEDVSQFDLWGSLDSLVMEAAAAKVQAAARGRMGRQRAAEVAEAQRMHAAEVESKRQSDDGDRSGGNGSSGQGK